MDIERKTGIHERKKQNSAKFFRGYDDEYTNIKSANAK